MSHWSDGPAPRKVLEKDGINEDNWMIVREIDNEGPLVFHFTDNSVISVVKSSETEEYLVKYHPSDDSKRAVDWSEKTFDWKNNKEKAFKKSLEKVETVLRKHQKQN